jgi:hypothetical protein
MHRLSTHVSTDGVMVSTFYSAAPTPLGLPDSPRDVTSQHGPKPADSCSPSGQLTLEISDTQAVAMFTEPFYGGFTAPLIDVEIGELGVTEGKPATWVEAEVGPQARQVVVQFADGSRDSVAPVGGGAVLASLGDASSTLGNGTHAYLGVLGTGGSLLAKYGIGVGAPSSSGRLPTDLPSTTAAASSQPRRRTIAINGVTRALTTALSCSEPPVLQAQAVSGGGPFEELGGAGSAGLASGDRVVADTVVFTSSTSAVVRYHLESARVSDPQSLYADASLVHGTWLLSLGSVAPGLQVAPPNQDGDVAVAPGGPLFVHTGDGGVAIAVYRAVQSSSSGQSSSSSTGCGASACTAKPSTECAPSGGIVEEITTPGAVGIESAPLFRGYSDPIIGIGLSIVGEAEGAPATLVGVEVGPSVRSVTVDSAAGTQSIAPVDGEADIVLNGAPSTAIGSKGGGVAAIGKSGDTIASVPLLVDSTEPAPASSLPQTLPEPRTGPSDPAAATSAIDQAFSTVFDCANSPLVRSDEIEDNGMFANPLEQLYVGPYTNLVESVYATVGQVVFVDPELADVSYTIRFHDSSLTFDMIGSAVVVDGSWRVSYATLCAAVSLGGVSCSS